LSQLDIAGLEAMVRSLLVTGGDPAAVRSGECGVGSFDVRRCGRDTQTTTATGGGHMALALVFLLELLGVGSATTFSQKIPWNLADAGNKPSAGPEIQTSFAPGIPPRGTGYKTP
jgi:hypothetical protein